MRKTLEDFYYGNITPNEQVMNPNSELRRATDRVARFENQLMEQLSKPANMCQAPNYKDWEDICKGAKRE